MFLHYPFHPEFQNFCNNVPKSCLRSREESALDHGQEGRGSIPMTDFSFLKVTPNLILSLRSSPKWFLNTPLNPEDRNFFTVLLYDAPFPRYGQVNLTPNPNLTLFLRNSPKWFFVTHFTQSVKIFVTMSQKAASVAERNLRQIMARKVGVQSPWLSFLFLT